MRNAGTSLLLAALGVISGAAAPPAREDAARPGLRDPAEAAVWVTTDRGAVSGCAVLPALVPRSARSADNSLDALRREAVRRGADVLLIRSLSEGSIEADLYRCAGAPAVPRASTAPVPPLPVPRAPAPAPAPAPRESAPDPLRPPAPAAPESSAPPVTERQRRARAELEALKATLRVVEDPALVANCEKRGEGRGDEDTLRADAVAANANVLLRVPAAGSPVASVSAEYFRCAEPLRTLRPTPAHTPRPGGG